VDLDALIRDGDEERVKRLAPSAPRSNLKAALKLAVETGRADVAVGRESGGDGAGGRRREGRPGRLLGGEAYRAAKDAVGRLGCASQASSARPGRDGVPGVPRRLR
jgi:hypothetical protein